MLSNMSCDSCDRKVFRKIYLIYLKAMSSLLFDRFLEESLKSEWPGRWNIAFFVLDNSTSSHNFFFSVITRLVKSGKFVFSQLCVTQNWTSMLAFIDWNFSCDITLNHHQFSLDMFCIIELQTTCIYEILTD